MIIGTEENFKKETQNGTVLVDFFATWCGPCKMLSPILEEMSNERSDVKIVKVDVDKCESLAREFGVMSIPTLVLFKNGELVKKQTGFMPKDYLQEWIEK